MELYKNTSIHFIRSNPELILPKIWKKLKSAFNPFPENPKPGVLETGRWLFQFRALLALIHILFFTQQSLLRSLVLGLIISTIRFTILTYSGFRFRMPHVGLELLFLLYVIDDILKRINKQKSTTTIKKSYNSGWWFCRCYFKTGIIWILLYLTLFKLPLLFEN